MPGLLWSTFGPAEATVEARWRIGLALATPTSDFHVDEYAEPGFLLAVVYRKTIFTATRIWAEGDYVIACYGEIHEQDWPVREAGEALCKRLLARFVAEGEAGLQHLNGRYDVVVWHRESRRLTHVSDRFGAHRHYWCQRPGLVAVACEVKALAPLLDDIRVSAAGLIGPLQLGHQLADYTVVDGIRRLPNALTLRCRGRVGEVDIQRYWNYPYGELATEAAASIDESAETLFALLQASVRRRLREVDKVLLPLSGGLDSRTLAGVIAHIGYTGDVVSYTFGQPSSHDVRYARAIAKAVGVEHRVIPTPPDFIARFIEDDAWRFDGEWAGELGWMFRHGHDAAEIRDTRDYCVVSGMYGDMVMGIDRYRFRRRLGDQPLDVASLVDNFHGSDKGYGTFDDALSLFDDAHARSARLQLDQQLVAMFEDMAVQPPWLALMRAEFRHRQTRHTAMVAHGAEQYRRVVTPFLDRDLVDWATRLPMDLWHGQTVYKAMIRNHLPKLAAIPKTGTGMPIAPTRLQQALAWRKQKLLVRFPGLRRWLNRRANFFDFNGNVRDSHDFFAARAGVLRELSPPLDAARVHTRFMACIDGQRSNADQASALLPPALFLSALKQRLGSDTAASNEPQAR